MRDMRAHDIDMLTIGQYLQPTAGHLPVLRYVHPDTFAMFEREANRDGLSPRRRRREWCARRTTRTSRRLKYSRSPDATRVVPTLLA